MENKKTAAGEQALFEACQTHGLTPEQFNATRHLLINEHAPNPAVPIEGPRTPMNEVFKKSGLFM